MIEFNGLHRQAFEPLKELGAKAIGFNSHQYNPDVHDRLILAKEHINHVKGFLTSIEESVNSGAIDPNHAIAILNELKGITSKYEGHEIHGETAQHIGQIVSEVHERISKIKQVDRENDPNKSLGTIHEIADKHHIATLEQVGQILGRERISLDCVNLVYLLGEVFGEQGGLHHLQGQLSFNEGIFELVERLSESLNSPEEILSRLGAIREKSEELESILPGIGNTATLALAGLQGFVNDFMSEKKYQGELKEGPLPKRERFAEQCRNYKGRILEIYQALQSEYLQFSHLGTYSSRLTDIEGELRQITQLSVRDDNFTYFAEIKVIQNLINEARREINKKRTELLGLSLTQQVA